MQEYANTQFFIFYMVSDIGFLCAEKVLPKSDLDKKKKELDEMIDKLSQQCAKTDKKSPTVRHYCTPDTPKP